VNRPRIVVDTDPGQDDALAILLALAERERLDLVGITTVAGNVPIDRTTANALRIVEVAGRADVPVHRGAGRPLLRPLATAEHVCGADGLDGAGLPPPAGGPSGTHAVAFLVDTLESAADRSVTLCTLGPLTNVALAFAQDPSLAAKVERIVAMGGARDLGNITPAAEFNFYVDPHAAKIVLGLGVPVTLFALNATHQALATPERVAAIAALGTPVARCVTGMLTRRRPGLKEKFGVDAHPMHDPCVIAFLLWPELFTHRDCHVAVETDSELSMGRSVIDWWGVLKRPANAQVIDRVDAQALFERMTASLARLR
jgi:purine nucleosidase